MTTRHRVPLHRSLLARLLVTSMAIAVCAIAATAWLTVRLTTRAVTEERSRTLSADTDVYDTLIGYAASHSTWDGVDTTIRRMAYLTGRRITLTTPERRPIGGSGPDLPPDAVPTATIDPLHLDAAVARGSGGRIDPRAVGPYRLTDPERRLLRKAADDQVECLGGLGVLAEAVDTPSGRPIVRLVSAAAPTVSSRCEAYRTLATPTETERQPLAELTTAVRACAGTEHDFAITPDQTIEYRARPPSTDHVDACLDDARREQLRPYVAPPALLFVTGPTTVTAPTVDLSRANTLRIVGTTGIVLLMAFAATVLVGVRLVRPLRLLTDAARLPVDAQKPVPVTTRDEIGHLATAFNDLSERRRVLEHQRKAMASDVAHELRTPLTNIRTWLEAARDGVTDIDPQVLDLLIEESILLHHVVDDLRDLADADAGVLRIHPESTFVRDVLGQVLDAHRGAADRAGVRLSTGDDADPEVIVDPVRLRQLLGNLVSNAIRHTPAGGTVTVRAAARDGRLVVTVSDTGSGIDPADLPKVFDRFWRADTARGRGTGGSGLGLSIARQLARSHGGDVTVDSRPGEGATFTVDIPA